MCKSLACVLSLQIQYSEDRSWTILVQAGQRPICLNWRVKAHGIASVPSIRFHSTKSMRHIHALRVSKYVFELGSGCSSEQILTFLPDLAFRSTFVPINVTAQLVNKYTKVQIELKQINSSRYPQATFYSATRWLQAAGGNTVQVNGKKILNAEELEALGSSSQPLHHWQDKRLHVSRVQAHRKAQIKWRP